MGWVSWSPIAGALAGPCGQVAHAECGTPVADTLLCHHNQALDRQARMHDVASRVRPGCSLEHKVGGWETSTADGRWGRRITGRVPKKAGNANQWHATRAIERTLKAVRSESTVLDPCRGSTPKGGCIHQHTIVNRPKESWARGRAGSTATLPRPATGQQLPPRSSGRLEGNAAEHSV